MAEIVLGGALSHSPLINMKPEQDRELIGRFEDGVAELSRRVREVEPDVVLVFGPDHFRSLFYDLMPAFVMGLGKLVGWGDWDSPVGPFETHRPLAKHILASVMEAGFEPTFSYDLKVDHGITQPLEMLDLQGLPLVPVLINAAGPPLPTPRRCFDLGAAVADAVACFPGDARVVVLGSGGLSHDPPTPDPESTDEATVARAVHGRTSGFAESRERETKLLEHIDDLAARINPEWDRRILDRFARGEAEALSSELDTDGIYQAAGNGGQEIRTWFAVAGALGDPEMDVLAYEPIPALVTGMGVVAAELRQSPGGGR